MCTINTTQLFVYYTEKPPVRMAPPFAEDAPPREDDQLSKSRSLNSEGLEVCAGVGELAVVDIHIRMHTNAHIIISGVDSTCDRAVALGWWIFLGVWAFHSGHQLGVFHFLPGRWWWWWCKVKIHAWWTSNWICMRFLVHTVSMYSYAMRSHTHISSTSNALPAGAG